MLLFCGFLTLALNTADAISHRDFGTALVDAVGPVLLIGWSEVGPWMLRQVYTVSAPPEPSTEANPEPLIPSELLARARELDTAHRASTGRPISRDTLRGELRIGRDRASTLVKVVRTMPTPATEAELPTAA